ncbi:MAG: MerR family transcriptional regulator [Thermoanaerobaculia bacterium]
MARAAADEKLYKIGEVCKMADVQPYVLRYWETEFLQLAPNKSGGGQRLYTKGEIDIVLRIKELLYRDGFTIAGAKKKLESDLAEPEPPPVAVAVAATVPSTPAPAAPDATTARALQDVKRELYALLDLLGD